MDEQFRDWWEENYSHLELANNGVALAVWQAAYSLGLAKGRKEGIGKIGTVCIYDSCTNTQYDNLKGIERGTYDLYVVRQVTPIK